MSTAVIDGLKPATDYELVVETPQGEGWVAQRFTTLEPPPGPLLCKFATINDIHFGEHWFGYLKTIEEPHPLGTGGALKFAEELLQERFLMLNGDVSSADEAVDLIRTRRSDAVLCNPLFVGWSSFAQSRL